MLKAVLLANLVIIFYLHMPIGKVWIYRLLFVLFVCLFICTVTDFSVQYKASGVKFCTAVHRRLPFLWTLLPKKPKTGRFAQRAGYAHRCSISRDVGSACVDIDQFPLAHLFLICFRYWFILVINKSLHICCSETTRVCRRQRQ